MSSKKLAVLLAVTLLLAGCSGAGLGSDSAQSGGDAQADFEGSAPVEENAESDNSGSVQADAATQQRAIVRSGRMVVEVSNFSESRDAITAQATQYGGYVSDSDRRLHRDGDATWSSGYIVLRVPSERYETMRDDVRTEGTVVSESTETEDVTDQLVDLEARLTNLRDRRDRLRTFYDRANDTEELLSVERELSEVQGEIERLEAQKRSLEQRVAYSTIRVELEEDRPDSTRTQIPYHEQPLVGVFLDSLTDVYVFGRAALVTLAAAAPWLGVLAVPAFGIRRLLRNRGLPFVGEDE